MSFQPSICGIGCASNEIPRRLASARLCVVGVSLVALACHNDAARLLPVGVTPVDIQQAETVQVADLVELFPQSVVRSETRIVDFSDSGTLAPLIDGWDTSALGKGGRVWGVGEASSLVFFLTNPRPLELQFRCAPFRFPDAPRQLLSILLNNHRVGSFKLKPGMWDYKVELPADQLRAGENILEFHYAHSWRPIDVNEGKDRRQLAAHWLWIRFVGVPEPDVAAAASDRSIHLRHGTRLDYFLDLPSGSVLQWQEFGSSASGSKWRQSGIRVEVQVAGEVPRAFDIPHTYGSTPLQVDLGPAEQTTRISLQVVPTRISSPSAVGGSGLRIALPEIRTGHKVDKRIRPVEAAVSSLADSKPNLIVYLIDTLRADHLGCYGYGRPTSPRIDQFASDATLFRNGYAQSSWTRSSVASIFTGLYPTRHRTNGRKDVLPDSAQTLAELLHEIGYTTAAFVTNGNVSRDFGLSQGFDVYDHLPEQSTREIHQLSDRLNERVFTWLEDASRAGPFFLYVHATDPHAPYTPRSARR